MSLAHTTHRAGVARALAGSLVIATIIGLCPPGLHAQRAAASPTGARFRPAFRADALLDRDPGAQLAGGIVAVAAYNLRLALDLGVGGMYRPTGWNASGRVDLLARWLSDPFRESHWGVNAGGGLGMQMERGRAPRPVAIVTLGVEGRGDGMWVPGVELGLGGGVRAGLTLRRASARRR